MTTRKSSTEAPSTQTATKKTTRKRAPRSPSVEVQEPRATEAAILAEPDSNPPLRRRNKTLGEELVQEVLSADQTTEGGVHAQRTRIATLRRKLAPLTLPSPPSDGGEG